MTLGGFCETSEIGLCCGNEGKDVEWMKEDLNGFCGEDAQDGAPGQPNFTRAGVAYLLCHISLTTYSAFPTACPARSGVYFGIFM